MNLRAAITALDLHRDDVIVILDGDDFLKPEALERIERAYEDPEVWLAYGSYEAWPANTGQVPARPYPDQVLDARSFRSVSIFFNHPITFRHRLWRGLDDGDFRDNNGVYFTGGADFILMVPMLEMAGREHILFMEEVIYCYNAINPLADNLVNDPARQGQIVGRPMKARL
jgi:cellulose synthase/poly-beta-1,6-N-acetylglucosamine synthase-like glycosyltransferase